MKTTEPPYPINTAPALRIGLTGGIGSGKSTVGHIFSVLGIPVFDADAIARKIMNTDGNLMNRIRDTFGGAAYVKGVLDRKYLASVVFNDPYKLSLLNALVHPATIAAFHQWAGQQAAPYIIKEAALLFESGTAGDLDYVIGVYAPRQLRIARVMKRDDVKADAVIKRMQNQIAEEMKMHLCDFVATNAEQSLLVPQVIKLHHKFLQQANKLRAAIV